MEHPQHAAADRAGGADVLALAVAVAVAVLLGLGILVAMLA